MVREEAIREGLTIIQSVIIECYWGENDDPCVEGWGSLCVSTLERKWRIFGEVFLK